MAALNRPAVFEDLLLLQDPDRIEIIDGEIVHKAAPSAEHSGSQTHIVMHLGGFDRRRAGSRGPGGWWLLAEIHVEYQTHQVYCHDVAGWRRDRVAEKPSGWPVKIRPDWVCEIVSPKHEKHDVIAKPKVLHRAEVPHLWLVNPLTRTLHVQRWTPSGYTTVLAASSGEKIRAEPFDAVELSVDVLFGDDDDVEDTPTSG